MRSLHRVRLLPYITFCLFVCLLLCLYIIFVRQKPHDCPHVSGDNKTSAGPFLEQRDLDATTLRQHPVIFVGGFPRSGTTLMRTMLDAHPDVRCGEETRVIPRMLFMRDNWVKGPLEKKRLTSAGIDESVLNDAVSAFLSQIIVKHGDQAKRYCNKDPFAMKSALYVNQLYKKSKFIFMIRDGRASIHSVIRRKITISGFDLKDFKQCLTQWDNAVDKMWRQCQELGISRCLPVWYEMLVQNPRKIGAKVIEFLELPWNESVLHQNEAVGKPGGVRLSQFERSNDQVQKPIYLTALKEFVGNVPSNVQANLSNVAPMIEFLGYDASRDPNYTSIQIPAEYRLFYEDGSTNY